MAAEDEFAKELAKQLPVKAVYQDAIHPAAKQAGDLGEDVMKAVRLALAPIQLLAVAQDRFRRFIENSVERVPPERQISPPPQIVGPVLEGVRYETEGTPIDEMFSQLLSASMDMDRVKDAHPAFPLIIKQLSSDEAKLLAAISRKTFRSVSRFTIIAGGAMSFTETESDELTAPDLTFPNNIPLYREHLDQLGLITSEMEKPFEPIMTGTQQTGGRNFFRHKLTPFGEVFMRASAPASSK